MADIILKNSDGKIWKNSDGKILKAKVFSEEVIQSGLAFWGVVDPDFITIIDGLVSEVYDCRNNGLKMTQSVVANRPTYSESTLNYLRFESGAKHLVLSGQNIRSMFIVFKCNEGSIFPAATSGIGDPTYGLGMHGVNTVYCVTGGNYQAITKSPHYVNLTKYLSTGLSMSSNYNLIAVSSIDDFRRINVNAYLKNWSGNSLYYSSISIIEWGWYNRVLSEMEVVYNQNALMKRYNIT